jgi:heme exporter protein C
MLSVLIYVAYTILRSFAAGGEAERRFAAALGVLGAANLPIIKYSVQKWGGQHPTVISKGGGGLQHPDMKLALLMGLLSFALLCALMIWHRTRIHTAATRLEALEQEAIELDLGEA